MKLLGRLWPPPSRRRAWKLGLLVLLRATLTVSALLLAYFLIPTKPSAGGSDVPLLILELVVFAVIVLCELLAIVKAGHPVLRALEAGVALIPLFLLIFARIYLANSQSNPEAFTRPLDSTTALYFTVTVFATVGFGDIVAQTNGMRLLVTIQMLLNLIVLGLVVRLLVFAARHGVAHREQELGGTGPGVPTREGSSPPAPRSLPADPGVSGPGAGAE